MAPTPRAPYHAGYALLEAGAPAQQQQTPSQRGGPIGASSASPNCWVLVHLWRGNLPSVPVNAIGGRRPSGPSAAPPARTGCRALQRRPARATAAHLQGASAASRPEGTQRGRTSPGAAQHSLARHVRRQLGADIAECPIIRDTSSTARCCRRDAPPCCGVLSQSTDAWGNQTNSAADSLAGPSRSHKKPAVREHTMLLLLAAAAAAEHAASPCSGSPAQGERQLSQHPTRVLGAHMSQCAATTPFPAHLKYHNAHTRRPPPTAHCIIPCVVHSLCPLT
jgi:hypothetical protein